MQSNKDKQKEDSDPNRRQQPDIPPLDPVPPDPDNSPGQGPIPFPPTDIPPIPIEDPPVPTRKGPVDEDVPAPKKYV